MVKCNIWTYGHCLFDNLKLLRDDLTADGWEWDNHYHKFRLISASNQRKRSDGPGRGLGCSPSCRDHHMVALHLCHLYLSPMSPVLIINVRKCKAVANYEIVIFTPYASHPLLTSKSRHFAIIGWFWLESSLHLPLSSYTGEEMQEALQQIQFFTLFFSLPKK